MDPSDRTPPTAGAGAPAQTRAAESKTGVATPACGRYTRVCRSGTPTPPAPRHLPGPLRTARPTHSETPARQGQGARTRHPFQGALPK